MANTQPASKTKTLIVVHGDKYVDVFSNEEHAVKIVNVPDMISTEGELLIEELLAIRLPQHWSKVYSDGFLVNRDATRDVSIVEVVRRDNDLALIRTLNRHVVSDGNAMVPK